MQSTYEAFGPWLAEARAKHSASYAEMRRDRLTHYRGHLSREAAVTHAWVYPLFSWMVGVMCVAYPDVHIAHIQQYCFTVMITLKPSSASAA